MRKSHMYLFGVAIATFGFVAVAPATAQDTAPVEAPGASMTPEQQAQFDSWPVEQQTEYELWPMETKGYYWSLTPDQQMIFWRLSDEDKIALTAMTGPERDAAWTQIESRATGGSPPEG